jgi:hypothetical protein
MWGHPATLPNDTLEPTDRLWAEFDYPTRWRYMEDAIKRGADIVTPRHGRTILSAAVSKGYRDMTRMLLRYGAITYMSDIDAAIDWGDPEMLKIVLNANSAFSISEIQQRIDRLEQSDDRGPVFVAILREYIIHNQHFFIFDTRTRNIHSNDKIHFDNPAAATCYCAIICSHKLGR